MLPGAVPGVTVLGTVVWVVVGVPRAEVFVVVFGLLSALERN